MGLIEDAGEQIRQWAEENESLRAQLLEARADCAAKDEALKLTLEFIEGGNVHQKDHELTDAITKALKPSPGQPIIERLRKVEDWADHIEQCAGCANGNLCVSGQQRRMEWQLSRAAWAKSREAFGKEGL